MADLRQFYTQHYSLSEEATDALLRATTTRSYRKGQYLLRKGHICEHLYFINSGLAKSFFLSDDKEFVMRFFADNVLFSVFESFVPGTPSKFMVTALEPTTCTLIAREALDRLCREYHSIETMYRQLLGLATVKMTRRISEMLEGDAATRYHKFVEDNQEVIQRLSLGEIAKYLGITQQSLSRIRATPFFTKR